MSYKSFRQLKKQLKATTEVAREVAPKDCSKVTTKITVTDNDVTTEASFEEEQWHKLEQCMFKNGVAALAAAVINQWRIDGKPKVSEDMIEMWYGVFKAANEQRIHAAAY